MRNYLFMPLLWSGFLLSLSLVVNAAHAQTRFSIGPRVGGVASTSTYDGNPAVSASPYLKTAYKIGFEAGVQANLRLRRFAIQPALLYRRDGFKLAGAYVEPFTANNLAVNINQSFRLNYLVLPVNVAYSFTPNGQGLQVFAGGYVGALLGGEARFDDATESDTGYKTTFQLTEPIKVGSESQNNNDQYFKRFDAGLQAGIGYLAGKLLLQASYSLGLADTGTSNPSNAAIYQSGPVYHNRAFLVHLSYLFVSR